MSALRHGISFKQSYRHYDCGNRAGSSLSLPLSLSSIVLLIMTFDFGRRWVLLIFLRRWVLLKIPRCDIDGVGEGK